MTDFLLIGGLVLLLAVVVLLLMLLRKASQTNTTMLASRLDSFEKTQERIERAVREEVAQSRDELGKAAREQRQELTEAFKIFGDSVVQRMTDVASVQKGQLDAFSSQLGSFAKASGERLDGARAESATGGKQLREEVVAMLKSISETMAETMKDLAAAEKPTQNYSECGTGPATIAPCMCPTYYYSDCGTGAAAIVPCMCLTVEN